MRKEEELRRIFNASNVLGTVAFIAMIAAPGAVESGSYIMALLFIAVFAGCSYLSIKEDGKKR